MGITNTIVKDIWDVVEDVVSFFIISFLIVFVLGAIWGMTFQGTEKLWWPLYLLFIALLIKVGKDALK